MIEKKTQKGIGRGIILKQLGLILPVTLLFAASLAMGFYSMFGQKGDAKNINYTGQLRYRSYQLALFVNKYPTLQGGEKDHAKRDILNLEGEFETILYGLRDGNKALGLKGFKMPPNIEEGIFSYNDPWWQFNRHVQDFQERIKPLILHILKFEGQEEAKDAIKMYNKEVPLLVGDIDRTVHLLQQLSERKISEFHNAEFIILGLFFTVVGVSFFLSTVFVRRPLLSILRGINAFSRGDLDHRIPVKGKDEIAVMARGINAMVEAIKKDRKEIEAGRNSLYEILGSIGCLVRVVNPRDHTVSFQNKPLQALFPQGLSNPCYTLLAKDKECDRCTSMEAIEEGRDFYKEEKGPGGRFYQVHSFPLANPDGTVTTAIEVIKDITASKKMEGDLEESRMRLLESQKVATIGHLSTGIAHFLHNPLSGINLSAEVLIKKLGQLQDGPVLEECKGHLTHIKVASRRCEEVVKDLLKISNIPKPKKSPTDLNEAVEHVLGVMSHQMEVSKVRLLKTLSSTVPKILGSHSQLETVFMNLLSNALDAMPEGGTLTVMTRHITGEDKVEATIMDTSGGILKEELPHVFDPYVVFKIRPATRCTGLELPLAQLIIQLHGGTIGVDSEIGKGTAFKVRLPVCQEEVLPVVK